MASNRKIYSVFYNRLLAAGVPFQATYELPLEGNQFQVKFVTWTFRGLYDPAGPQPQVLSRQNNNYLFYSLNFQSLNQVLLASPVRPTGVEPPDANGDNVILYFPDSYAFSNFFVSNSLQFGLSVTNKHATLSIQFWMTIMVEVDIIT
jgi:hypothetical protein